MSKPDYILDIASLTRPAEGESAPAVARGTSADRAPRPWLAIQWRCCSVYSRVYRHPDAKVYEARCPRCARSVRIAVGEGGTDARFFEVR